MGFLNRIPAWMESYRRSHNQSTIALLMVLLSPLIALSVYRGTFSSFQDAYRYFSYIADSKDRVEVSEVTVRVGLGRADRLRDTIQDYAAKNGLIVRFGRAHLTNVDRELISFSLVGPVFQITIDNRFEEDVFVANFFDSNVQDWIVYRDDFVAFFAAIFGKANVQVIEQEWERASV